MRFCEEARVLYMHICIFTINDSQVLIFMQNLKNISVCESSCSEIRLVLCVYHCKAPSSFTF